MAKSVSAVTKYSGKLGDVVHVQTANGEFVRKAPSRNSGRDNPEFKEQAKITAFLNQIASEINTAAIRAGEHYKNKQFYRTIQKKIRNNFIENRFVLLHRLKGIQIAKQPLDVVCSYELITQTNPPYFDIELRLNRPPHFYKYEPDCFFFGVTLVTWSKLTDPVKIEQKRTEWRSTDAALPVFDFRFTREPETINWMIIVRLTLGVNNEDLRYWDTTMAQIADVGTFDENELKLLREHEASLKEQEKNMFRKTKEDDEGWVKARE
ncbi:MAG TPA: hypothetical protein VK498_06740 [Ferruginibacter sp.]|nr:hypothetical protein [Ferruginibacter sp.]